MGLFLWIARLFLYLGGMSPVACRKLTILLYCCFLLLSVLSYAQIKQLPYTFQHYTDEDGLPQNSVKCLAPDEHGFMWMATENGLVRFDGKQFLTFNGSNLALRNSRILHICPDVNGKGVLARTALQEALVVRNGKAALTAPGIRDFNYLYYDDFSTIYPISYLPDPFLPAAVTDKYLVALGPDTYFKITWDSISFVEKGTERYMMRNPGIGRGRAFVLDGQLCYLNEQGRFILLKQDGMHVLTLEGDLLQHRRSAVSGQREEIYWSFTTGQLFIYADRSCYRLSLVNGSTVVSKLVLTDFDLPGNSIGSVYHDSLQQRVFLGSRTKGLYVCKWKQFRNFKSGYGNEVYYAQAPFGDDKILTPDGVIFSRDGKVSLLPRSSKSNIVDKYSITRDMNGNYWYKSYWTLFKFSPDMSTVLWKQKLADGLTQLYPGSNDRLWVGTRKHGLYYLQITADHPELKRYSAGLKDVSYLMQEGPDTLWVGTGNGLYRIRLSSGKIDSLPEFGNRYVRSLYIPRSGEVWITTYNYGVFLYKDGRLTHLPMDPKAYLEASHCIVADNRGFLWITTNKGLFQVSYEDVMAYVKGKRKELFYLYYGKDQGFSTNEFNGGCQPCALRLSNGDISLPSLDGLVYFTPSGIQPELPDKQIFIDQAELDGRMMDVDSTILLPDHFRNLRLFISTPYFGDHNNLLLYYSLEDQGGGDKSLWLKVNDNRMIEFSSIHSGRYKLRIRKINGFGSDKIMERVFIIRVQEAFYETLWFRLLVLGVTLVIAFAFFLLLVERVKRKNRELEARVKERTSELKETLDNLQLSEQQLRRQGFIQRRLTAAMSHDLKTPLKYMMQVLRKGAGDKAEIEKDERKVVYESLYSMFHLVENLISYMRSQYVGDDSSLEITDLYYLLEEKAGIFRSVSEAKGVSIVNETSPGSLVLVNRQLLAIVVHNLLDNAVKYTRKGQVRLQAFSDEENIYIRIADTGIGMPEALSAWMNQNRNGMSIAEGKPHAYDGIGLLIVMELLQLISGSIVVSPNTGNGTIIDITLAIVK